MALADQPLRVPTDRPAGEQHSPAMSGASLASRFRFTMAGRTRDHQIAAGRRTGADVLVITSP